jgi:hypothetical protein
MPSKSKRNRRAQAQREYLQRVASKNRNESINQALADPKINPSGTQAEKNTTSYGSSSKGAPSAAFAQSNFSKDIKWIGIVTGIIVILLIVSYYVFK